VCVCVGGVCVCSVCVCLYVCWCVICTVNIINRVVFVIGKYCVLCEIENNIYM